jgi:tRNA(Arg) A34 adenosine deaminase TadA
MQQFKHRTNITGKVIERTKKTDRCLALAKNVAYNSPYGKLRHGAVLIKGGSIINISFNKENYTSFGTRFRNPSRGHATVHAEIGCILGMSRNVTTGSDLYVCRINKEGEFRNSKPCSMCHEALKHVGVKRVYYTTNNNTIEMYKL